VPLPVTDGSVRSRVLPGWTAAEQRAEAEVARAEAEAAARQRAEAELARLRARIVRFTVFRSWCCR
jgi:regulator of protease activity HflC (stomatin/prohibitin superfamily)